MPTSTQSSIAYVPRVLTLPDQNVRNLSFTI